MRWLSFSFRKKSRVQTLLVRVPDETVCGWAVLLLYCYLSTQVYIVYQKPTNACLIHSSCWLSSPATIITILVSEKLCIQLSFSSLSNQGYISLRLLTQKCSLSLIESLAPLTLPAPHNWLVHISEVKDILSMPVLLSRASQWHRPTLQYSKLIDFPLWLSYTNIYHNWKIVGISSAALICK